MGRVDRTDTRRTNRLGLRPERIAVALAAVVAVAAVGWVAFRVAGREDARGGPGDFDEPGVSHVHGLGVNPADGSLIVATHFGSFRLAAGSASAVRIGDSFQDTMGFTVAGPNRFIGSGHPDVAGIRAGQPTRLGLIESTDAGATWRAVSLSGDADFHGLAFAHGQVYGWDSGTSRFMVSRDRKRWETRSTIDMLAFAVDPDDAEHIVSSGQAGLAESTNGGRTWERAEGPPLIALSWDADAGLWGADAAGRAWHHDNRWSEAGELGGEPQALLATRDALYAAVGGSGQATAIVRSTDEGRTWRVLYRDRSH